MSLIGKKLVLVLATAAFLTGCETMFAHYRMSPDFTARIAQGNAAVNLCLSRSELDRNLGYTFNFLSAQVLDISVVDREFYKASYEGSLTKFERDVSPDNCAKLASALPAMNEYMAKSYSDIANSLGQARAVERQQIATTLAGFGRPAGGFTPMNPAPPQHDWPKLNYVEQPATANYLVSTSKGLVQCRVTNKNYVFCF